MNRRTPEGDASAGDAPADEPGRGRVLILSFLSGILLGAVLVAAGLAGASLWLGSPEGVGGAPDGAAGTFSTGIGTQTPGVGITTPFSAGSSDAAGETEAGGEMTAPAAPADAKPAAGTPQPDSQSGGGAATQPGGAGTGPGGSTAAEPASQTAAPTESGEAAQPEAQDTAQAGGTPGQTGGNGAEPRDQTAAPAESGTAAQPESRDAAQASGTPAQPEGRVEAQTDSGAVTLPDGQNAAQDQQPAAGPEVAAVAPTEAGATAQADGQAFSQEGQPEAEPETMAAQPDSTTMAEPTGTPAAVDPQRAAPAGQESAAAPEGAPGTVSAPDAAGAPGAALAVNARPFEAPPGEPLLSIVLVDEGRFDLTAETLSMLTMPLTVAIRPEAAGAARLGEAARAAGHEVLADLSLPQQGVPAAVAAEAVSEMATLDMAVGATATDGTAGAEVLASLMGALKEDGLAWVGTGAETPEERMAREAGVPFASATKVAADATADQTYRLIDRTARGALQGGSAVLFLGVSEPALQGLIRWGLEHPQPVSFAPVSAVIGKRRAT